MNRLKQIRMKKGVSQIALFARTGIWPSIISYIERQYLPASEEQQEKLAAALSVKKSRLFPRTRLNAKRRTNGQKP